jgi:tetrahydromethanopterin S-methyltransferase subunit B
MADKFHRNQNAAERTKQLNQIVEDVDQVEERVDNLEEAAGASNPAYDPGDLTVYYENGKA